jgi:hypothetical protein
LEQIQIAAGRDVSTAQPEAALAFHTHRPAWATYSSHQLRHPVSDDKDSKQAGWGPMVDTGLDHKGIQACAFSQDQTYFAVGKQLESTSGASWLHLHLQGTDPIADKGNQCSTTIA